MLLPVKFLGFEDGVVPKCSEEHSAVSDQESGVGGQRSGVITGVTNWSNLE